MSDPYDDFSYEDVEPNWDELDNQADQYNDAKRDDCAKLDKDIWDIVKYLPLSIAKHEGEKLQNMKQLNRSIALSIWPDLPSPK